MNRQKSINNNSNSNIDNKHFSPHPVGGYYIYENDEIDLYELFLVLWKRKIIIILTTLLFFIIGVIYCMTKKNIYKCIQYLAFVSTQNFNQNFNQNFGYELTKSAITPLSDALKQKDYKFLFNNLKLPIKLLTQLTNIEIHKDRRASQTFYIVLEGYDKKTLSLIMNKILTYITNSPVVTHWLNIKRKELLFKIQSYEKKLKTFQFIVNWFKKEIMLGKINLLGFNPLDLEKEILNLEIQIKLLKEELKLLSPYYKISFYLFPNPVKPKRKLIILVSIISGLFLGIFLAFFIEWLSNIKKTKN